jgi:DNA-binding CsgD family transcriptional regulator
MSRCDRQDVSVSALEPITSDTTAVTTADDSTAREDPDPLDDSLAHASQAASSEWLISRLTLKSFEPDWPALTASAAAAGASVKILHHQDDLRADPELAEFAKRVSTTAMVRTTCSRIPDMLISDRQTAIVFVNTGTLVAGSVKTSQPEAISFLTTLFDQAWNAAIPLPRNAGRQSPSGRPELLDAELQLLRLLAEGVTDETAARHLGVSLRTARRHMAGLMSRLAATSRFQAGAEAVRRGWLT